MINLHSKIWVCPKIYKRVTLTVYVKCAVRFNVNKILSVSPLINFVYSRVKLHNPSIYIMYRISSYSFRWNYSFFLSGNCSKLKWLPQYFNFLLNKLNFCYGNYSRAETMWWNTVCISVLLFRFPKKATKNWRNLTISFSFTMKFYLIKFKFSRNFVKILRPS